MVGVGVGSGEWQELDSPHEQDEPNLVTLLMAPVIFRPAPFMLATRANKNEREQLGSGYVSEIKMKFLPESCSFKWADDLAAKKWEKDFLKPNLSQNPMETRARMCERECEWVCEHGRAQHPSRPLFKEKMARAQEERQATTAMEPLEKVGPRSHWPWVGRPVGSAGPRVGPLVLPQRLSSLKIWCTTKSFLEKMSKLFFPKN